MKGLLIVLISIIVLASNFTENPGEYTANNNVVVPVVVVE